MTPVVRPPVCPRCKSDDPTLCNWVWLQFPPHLHGSQYRCCPDPFHGTPESHRGPAMAASTRPSTHRYIDDGTTQGGMCGRRRDAHPEISARYPTRQGGENGTQNQPRRLANSTT